MTYYPGTSSLKATTAAFAQSGWVEAGREKLDALRPIAARHGLTPLQLACAWNLSHTTVRCVAPTLIQEAGAAAKPIEAKRAELAAVALESPLSAEEVVEIRVTGDNTGSMLLKGATPDHQGEEQADRWPLGPRAGRAGAALGNRPRARPAQGSGAGLGLQVRRQLPEWRGAAPPRALEQVGALL